MNERLGIFEQRQADRARYERFAYKPPIPGVAATYHIVVDIPSAKKTITRLDVPRSKPVRMPPVVRPPLPRPPRLKTHYSRPTERKITDIINAVAEAYRVSVGELLSRLKPNYIARPRFAIVSLLRGVLKMSFPEIGQILGRDHTSILAAHSRCAQLRAQDSTYRRHYRTAARIVRRKWMA